MSSFTVEVSDLKSWLVSWHKGPTPWQWSVLFLSQHWYLMCSSPRLSFTLFQTGLYPNLQLFCPTEAGIFLFYHLNTVCIQTGLFAVYLNIAIPKTIVIVVLCCCCLPCTLMGIFPIPQNLRNLQLQLQLRWRQYDGVLLKWQQL